MIRGRRMATKLSAESLVPATLSPPPHRVIIFSGHMADAPDRPVPRFPQSVVPAVTAAIAIQLDQWQVGPADLCISGAARGGDILFAEICARRGAAVWLFIPLPEEEFLDESVRLPGAQWEARFHALRAHPRVRCFFQYENVGPDPDHLNVHARNNLWIIDTARALAPSPDSIYALRVWDEKPSGDGPGGTSDFGNRLRSLGAIIAPTINPVTLSSLNAGLSQQT